MTDNPAELPTRKPAFADVAAATRGLCMTSRSDAGLDELIHRHEQQGFFASRVIVEAARAELKRRHAPECSAGIHSWCGAVGRMPADLLCLWCGEPYGDPS